MKKTLTYWCLQALILASGVSLTLFIFAKMVPVIPDIAGKYIMILFIGGMITQHTLGILKDPNEEQAANFIAKHISRFMR